MGKRRFNTEWLEKIDLNGHMVKVWCIKKDEHTATCTLCHKDINVEHMGSGALKQHVKKQIHKGFTSQFTKSRAGETTESCRKETKEQCTKSSAGETESCGKETKNVEETKSQQKLMQDFFVKSGQKKSDTETMQAKVMDVGQGTSSQQDQTWTLKQMAVKAEIIAMLHFAAHNVSFGSAKNLPLCYQQQFPDSVIAKQVSIGPTKMSYMVSYGLGPYFRQMIIRDIIEGHSYYTLHFDETLSAQTKRHMDLLVHYWSERDNAVKVKYLTSMMFGHATADLVVKEMLQTFEQLTLPLSLMLSLGMDGPNVNKSILSKLNTVKKDKGWKQLVSCPTSCLIHVCHNSFRKGLLKYGFNAEKLCINLFYFFNKTSARQKDLFDIEQSLGLEKLVLQHHVQSRWLSLVPALQHLLHIKDALKKLLLEELPKQDKKIKENEKYLDVKKGLESKEVAVEIKFLIAVKPLFDEFITKFQKEEPMIHLLYPNCEKLLKGVMGRLLKSRAYTDKKGATLKQVDVEKVELQLNIEQFKSMQGMYWNFFCHSFLDLDLI